MYVLRVGSSFGELCLLGAVTRSIVTVTAVTHCEFFVIQCVAPSACLELPVKRTHAFLPFRRDCFLDAFSNLPEVLTSMIHRSSDFVRKPVWRSKDNRLSECVEHRPFSHSIAALSTEWVAPAN